MDAITQPTKEDLREAEAHLADVEHGKDAFMGSSAWGTYVCALDRVRAIRAALSSKGA